MAEFKHKINLKAMQLNIAQMFLNGPKTAIVGNNVLAAGFRYVVNISFKGFTEVGFKKVENIAEPVKTLKEAQEYKALVDETVAKACIVDRVTGKIVEWWVQ